MARHDADSFADDGNICPLLEIQPA